MKLTIHTLLMLSLVFATLISCNESKSPESDKNKEDVDTTTQYKDVVESDTVKEDIETVPGEPIPFVRMVAQKVVSKNFDSWSSFSTEKIFMSPYAHVDTTTMNSIKVEQLSERYESDKKLFWGIQDGTGDSLMLTFKAYVKRYVNDIKLMDTNTVSYEVVDEPVQRGNELHNIQHIFPNAVFVEAHKPADDDMGMNWRSLIFVLKKSDGKLQLIGLVHNEWTI